MRVSASAATSGSAWIPAAKRRANISATTTDIAAALSIASKTVETHKTRLMAKLGLQTRAQLVQYAMHLGWLSE